MMLIFTGTWSWYFAQYSDPMLANPGDITLDDSCRIVSAELLDADLEFQAANSCDSISELT
jgi:hypothetical protein